MKEYIKPVLNRFRSGLCFLMRGYASVTVLFGAALLATLLFPLSVYAEFKVGYYYTGITDNGDYLTYKWVIQVASDSTEPMYAMNWQNESLRQLGYVNIQNNRDWNLVHMEYPDGFERTVWYECTYSNRIFPGAVFSIQADISKRLISNPDRIERGIMTGLPLSEGGEGILATGLFRMANLHSSTGGMSKAWANQYGIVPDTAIMQAYNVAEADDPDKDGRCNLEEFIEGTDPTNRESRITFAFQSLEDGMLICPNPSPQEGREYFIQKMNEDGAWGDPQVFASPDAGCIDPTNLTHAIYKISVELSE